jgi:hypothetical protein
MLKARLILASLGLAFLAMMSLGVTAQDAKTTPQGKDIVTTEQQQQLARQFGDFMNALVQLKQRMQRGTPDEQKRAKVLGEVIDECKNLAINQEFSRMIDVLKSMKGTTGELQIAQEQSDVLANKLSRILNMIRDSRDSNLSDERKKLEEFIKELGKVIEKEKIVGAQNQQGKTDATELKKIQENVTDATAKLNKDIDKYLKPKDGQGKEAANLKGDIKDGGKEEGAKGEAKNDGKNPEGAKGEAKNEGDKKSDGPKGETKPGDKQGEQAKGGAKSGDKGKEGSPEAGAKKDKGDAKGKEGSAKGNEKGDKKGQEGSAKGGNEKGDKKDGPQGSAKGDDKKGGDKQGAPDSQAKAGDPKGGDPKSGAPKDAGAKDSKGGDKGSEAKAGGDPKAGDSKQGDAKAGDSKSGQGQAKAGGGDPKSGDSPPQSAQKGDNSPPPPPNAGNKQNDDIAKSNKQIKEAGYDQKMAEDEIAKKEKDKAGKNIADAVDKLEKAQKQLEKLLQQMREEELERVLAALQARCEKMLMMQTQVLVGTKDVHAAIQKHADKKPDRLDKNASNALADKEKEIVLEANKCIDILEAEGSAVAFPEVFQQIRQDMIHVQKRLELTDVAEVTQGIETDIIDTLKEMIDALKKAREENQASQGKPGEPGKSGKPGDQKLLELIQELKMVRALQKRVNDRTTTYGRQFPGQEQTNNPQVVRELRSLAERQQRIQEIVSRISKGDNK